MAIIVDEGEKKTNILGFVGWLVFLGVIGGAVYYIFFSQPQLVAIPAAGNLNAIAPITQLALHPDTVVQGAAFQALTSTIPTPSPQGPAQVNRNNPFIAP